MFVGLNPSKADEVEDDPNHTPLRGLCRRWGYGALCMVNLFAYRATEPRAMKVCSSPVGEENDRWLIELANGAEIIIAAWGTNGTHMNRDRVVMRLLAGKLSCLGKPKGGHPRHPLYMKRDVMPCPFP